MCIRDRSLGDTDFYKKQHRIALRNCGVINPEVIEEYIGTGGYQALGKVLTEMTPDDVIPVSYTHLDVYKRQVINVGIKGHGRLQVWEEADGVNLLRGIDLHPGNGQNAVFLGKMQNSRTVFTGIMIRYRDHIQPLYGRHPDNIARGHIVIPAR